MTPKLKFVLGGAVCGMIIGAVYASFIYDMMQRGKAESMLIESETNHVVPDEWEPERATSATVQRRAVKTKQEDIVTSDGPESD